MLESILGLVKDYSVYLLVALAVSEALALIPSFKSNSILQLVVNILKEAKKVVEKLLEKKEE